MKPTILFASSIFYLYLCDQTATIPCDSSQEAKHPPFLAILRKVPNNQTTMSPIQTTRMSNYRWVICLMLFLATTITYMDRQVLSLTWENFIAPEFAWTDEDYGRITGYFSLIYAIAMLLGGKFIDHAGVKSGYAWAMGVCTFGAIMHALCGIITCGIITDHWLIGFDGAKETLHDFGATGLVISTISIFLFTLCRTILAIGQSANFPAAIKVTAEYFPKKDRAYATAVFNTGASVGALFAPLTIPLMARSFGWEMAFLVIGSLGYLWILVWLFIYEQPDKCQKVNFAELSYISQDVDTDAEKLASKKQTPKSIGIWKCLRYRQTWAIIVGKFMTDGVWWFFLFWTPVFLSDTYAYSSDSPMGMVLIFLLYLITILSVAGGYLPTYFVEKHAMSPFIARRRAMLMFACVQLIGLFTLPMAGLSPWLFIIIVGLQGASHQSWSANIFSMVGDMFPKDSIATIIGIGGCAGGLASYIVMMSTGDLLHYAQEMGDMFSFAGYYGKNAAYMIFFCTFAFFYIIGWAVMKILIPTDINVTATANVIKKS